MSELTVHISQRHVRQVPGQGRTPAHGGIGATAHSPSAYAVLCSPRLHRAGQDHSGNPLKERAERSPKSLALCQAHSWSSIFPKAGQGIDIRLHTAMCVHTYTHTHTALRMSQKKRQEGQKTQEKNWIAIEGGLFWTGRGLSVTLTPALDWACPGRGGGGV